MASLYRGVLEQINAKIEFLEEQRSTPVACSICLDTTKSDRHWILNCGHIVCDNCLEQNKRIDRDIKCHCGSVTPDYRCRKIFCDAIGGVGQLNTTIDQIQHCLKQLGDLVKRSGEELEENKKAVIRCQKNKKKHLHGIDRLESRMDILNRQKQSLHQEISALQQAKKSLETGILTDVKKTVLPEEDESELLRLRRLLSIQQRENEELKARLEDYESGKKTSIPPDID